jgi:nucleoside-diphosphate-sugar epimerase
MGEIHAACWQAVTGRPPPRPLPLRVATLAAATADRLGSLAGRDLRLHARIATLTRPAWYDGKPFAAVTGFVPTCDLPEGIAHTVAWLRSRGDVS